MKVRLTWLIAVARGLGPRNAAVIMALAALLGVCIDLSALPSALHDVPSASQIDNKLSE